MIWFHEAAYKIMQDYDRPHDHDGPRHFEYGLSLMVGKLIRLVEEARGKDAALEVAKRIAWEAEGHQHDLSARISAEKP